MISSVPLNSPSFSTYPDSNLPPFGSYPFFVVRSPTAFQSPFPPPSYASSTPSMSMSSAFLVGDDLNVDKNELSQYLKPIHAMGYGSAPPVLCYGYDVESPEEEYADVDAQNGTIVTTSDDESKTYTLTHL